MFFGHLVGEQAASHRPNNGSNKPGHEIVLGGRVVDGSSEANRPRYVHAS